MLTLLDLSAAFDTIDHNIVINRLSIRYDISGTSYLTDRYQRMKIANCFSASLPTSCGVPHGSVLGPLLFTLYTTVLHSAQLFKLTTWTIYADYTTIYLSLTTLESRYKLLLKQLSDCIHDIFYWMTDSKLKLNANKTEFVIIGTLKQ